MCFANLSFNERPKGPALAKAAGAAAAAVAAAAAGVVVGVSLLDGIQRLRGVGAKKVAD